MNAQLLVELGRAGTGAGRPEVADFVAWLREEAKKEPR